MIEFTFMDETYGAVHRASPARDIAYFTPQLAQDVEQRLRDLPAEVTAAAGVTTEELIAGYVAFARFFDVAIDPDVKTPAECATVSGLAGLSPAVRRFVFDAFARTCLGAFWAGIRSATFSGEVPPGIAVLRRRGADLAKWLAAGEAAGT